MQYRWVFSYENKNVNYRVWLSCELFIIIVRARGGRKCICAKTRVGSLNNMSHVPERSIVCNHERPHGLILRGLLYFRTCRGTRYFFSAQWIFEYLRERVLFFVARKWNMPRTRKGGNPVRVISSAGRLDAAAPVFKHQMLAEVWSMLQAFLLPSELLPQKFRAAPFADLGCSTVVSQVKNTSFV